MKNLIIANNGSAINFDTETQEINMVSPARDTVHFVYEVTEPCHVKYLEGDTVKEADAKEGDIIVLFYEKEFPNHMIIVNSAEWKENIDTYNAVMQARKEEWAKRNAEDAPKSEIFI